MILALVPERKVTQEGPDLAVCGDFRLQAAVFPHPQAEIAALKPVLPRRTLILGIDRGRLIRIDYRVSKGGHLGLATCGWTGPGERVQGQRLAANRRSQICGGLFPHLSGDRPGLLAPRNADLVAQAHVHVVVVRVEHEFPGFVERFRSTFGPQHEGHRGERFRVEDLVFDFLLEDPHLVAANAPGERGDEVLLGELNRRQCRGDVLRGRNRAGQGTTGHRCAGNRRILEEGPPFHVACSLGYRNSAEVLFEPIRSMNPAGISDQAGTQTENTLGETLKNFASLPMCSRFNFRLPLSTAQIVEMAIPVPSATSVCDIPLASTR